METLQPDTHLSEQLLEEFALGRLQRERAPEVIEHLMFCDECNHRLEAEQNLREDLRRAAELSRIADARAPEKSARPWLSWLTTPSPVWAAAGACAVLMLFIPALRQDNSVAQNVELQSYRNGQVALAPTGSSLNLRLDTTSLDRLTNPEVTIVNDEGAQVWKGSPSFADGIWTAKVDYQLSAGLYWVRVTEKNNPGNMLREYSLRLR